MDINQLFSYVNNKETYTKESIELFKLTLEESPYFHAAHILLLKSLYINETNNYNSQLKISGTYISDKAKLFKFINENIASVSENTKQKTQKKEETKTVEVKKELTPEEKIKALKEKNLNKKKKEKPIETKETKEEVETLEKGEKNTNIDSNASQRHNGIITDFFKNKKPVEKIKTEKNKIEPVKKEQKNIKEQKSNDVTAKSLFEANKRKKEQKNITANKQKQTDIKTKHTKTIIEEKTPIKKEIKKTETTNAAINKKQEIKKVNSSEKTITKVEQSKPTIKNDKFIDKKKEKAKEVELAKKNPQTDAMSNIFSKIKAIKKEMNIDLHESDKKIIDVNKQQPEKNKIRTVKEIKNKEIKKVENNVFDTTTEAIDPFKQREKSTEKTSTVNKEKDETKIEIKEKKVKKEESGIKEESITAKDLFNRHVEKKNLEPNKQRDNKNIKNFVDEYVSEEPTKKIKQDNPIIEEKTEIKSIVETKKTIDKKEIKTDGKGSAADALLKRIAMKKQKIKDKEEQEKHENLELEEKKNEVEIIKKDTNKENLKEENKNKKEIEQNINIEEKISEKPNKKENNKEFEIDEKRKNDILKIKEANNINTEKKEKPAERSTNLIDDFINKSDNLERLGTKETKLKGDVSVDSTKENDEIITESIADLYIQQKHYKKAISAYEKLILKFPEKKTYFAIQIKKVESFI